MRINGPRFTGGAYFVYSKPMFGIAWPELLVIGVVAVVAIGPKDLPPLMRQCGRMAGKARAMMHEFQRHWDELAIEEKPTLSDMEKQADALQAEKYRQFGITPDQFLPVEEKKPPTTNSHPGEGRDPRQTP